MSSFIVTGATGFIGRALVSKLTEEGNKVAIICRKNSSVEGLNLDENQVFRMEDDINSLIKYFRFIKPDCVFNLASAVIVDHKSEDVKTLIDSNLRFPTYILEAMKESGVKKIINTGTYWQNANNSDYNPLCLYASTKEGFEKVLEYYCYREGFKAITLKLFDTYGEGDRRKKLINILAESAINGQEVGLSKGVQEIDLTHVDDVVRGFIRGYEYLEKIEWGDHREYALCNQRPLSIKRIVEIFERETNLKINPKWGEVSGGKREGNVIWSKYEILPNWTSKISIEEGVKRIVRARKRIKG